jgi:hypothetical protein
MLNRRSFLSAIAAIAAPVFARLALPAPPERKLLGDGEGARGRITGGSLYMRVGDHDWQYLGEVERVTFGFETSYHLKDAVFPTASFDHQCFIES